MKEFTLSEAALILLIGFAAAILILLVPYSKAVNNEIDRIKTKACGACETVGDTCGQLVCTSKKQWSE